MNFTVPDHENSDVLLKVTPKKVPVEETPSKFRSFLIWYNGSLLVIQNHPISIIYLYDLLKTCGMSEVLPIVVTLGPTTMHAIDWNPHNYTGKNVYYFAWKGIQCSITSDKSKGNGCSQALYFRVHDLTPGVGERVLDEIAVELHKHWKEPVPQGFCIIYTTNLTLQGFQWTQHSVKLYRDISTIYIDDAIKNQMVTQLTKFHSSSELYDRFGVTWKRVHLFHGLPGTGKTSTVLALASIFKKNIAKLTVTKELNSQHVENLFKGVPDNTWLLLEDVDALFTERLANAGIDFSTLLNCMDGLTTKRGLVLFMTTNHITKLDEAFLRPGRIDMCVEFKLPGRDELHACLKVLAPDYAHEHAELLDRNESMTIAGLQKHLFDCIMGEKVSIL